MRRVRRFAVIAGSVIVALLLIAGLILTLSWPRSAFTSVAMRFFLQQRNLHVAHGSVHVGHGVLDVTDFDVKDGSGNDFFLAKRITVVFEARGLIGRSDRRFGLHSVVLEHPVLRLIRLPDGSWNAAALSGGGAAAPATGPSAKVAPPYKLSVRIAAGEVQVIDPQAPVVFARAVSLHDVNGTLDLNEGSISRGSLRAQLRSAQGHALVQAAFFENDVLSFARATLAAHDVAIAPLVDAIAPSRSFAIERGRIDLRGQAYALAYPAGAPRWHLSADAVLRDGQMRVIPLVVPLRGLEGRLHFQDGLLSTTQLRGTAAGVPLAAAGGMQLFGGVRFALAVKQRGRLESQRRLFAFSRNLPLGGPSALQIRIDGPVGDIRVHGAGRVHNGRYGPVVLSELAGAIFYNQSHLTLTGVDETLAGGHVSTAADIDFGGPAPHISMLARAALPAANVPVLANISAAGTAQSFATLSGPLSMLTARGFGRLQGANMRARTFFTASPNELFLGPLLIQPAHGEIILAARTERSPRAPARHSFEAFATHAPLQVRAGSVAMTDVPSLAVSLPALSGVFDGSVFISGAGGLPAVAVNARADGLSMAGFNLQRVRLQALGRNGHVRIEQIAAEGGSTQARASGAVVLDRNLRPRVAALQGSANAVLAPLAGSAPGLRISGAVQGRFYVMLEGPQWTIAAQAHSADARLVGIPIQSANGVFTGASTAASSMLASVRLAGGEISAVGSLPRGGAQALPDNSIATLADHVDLRALHDFGVPWQSGSAVAIASLGGSVDRPEVRGGAEVSGTVRNVSVSGDIDINYRDGILQSDASRLSVDRNRAELSGSIRGLASGAPLSLAALDLGVRVREADVSALNRYANGNTPLTGAANANLHVGGSPLRPRIQGNLSTNSGTIRGVAFDELHGKIMTEDGHISLQQAGVQLGQSRFQLFGQVGPGTFAVHAASKHVDMSDFNDFFGGADVLAGKGAFRVNVSSSNSGVTAAGGLRLDDAAVRDYALGRIETHFSSDRGALLATVAQEGPSGKASISGRVAFQSYSKGLPNFSSAVYNIKANVSNLDVAALTPLLHQEDLGASGTLDVAGTLQGTLRRPLASARLNVHNGRVRRISITNLSGLAQSDASGVALRSLQIATRFATGSGAARFDFGTGRISGMLDVDSADLAEFGSVFRLPTSLGGEARAQIVFSGTYAKPRIQAMLTGTHDSVARLAFNEVKARLTYVPGALEIGDTQVALQSGGRLTASGALPLQLQPLALGPKSRPVQLSLTASDVNLAEFNPLTSPAASLNGVLNAQAALSGTAGNPSVSGAAKIRGGALESQWETIPLRNASADLSLLHDTITLSQLRGDLGSGSVNLAGAAHIVPAVGLRSNAGLQFYTNVAMHNASINVPGWLSGTVNGNVSLTRTAVTPYVAGAVALDNATIPFSAIIALASGSSAALASQAAAPQKVPGVPSPRPGHTIVYAGSIFGKTGGTLSSSPQATATPAGLTLPPVDLNVAVRAGKDVRVRGGSAIDLTADGGILIAGNLSKPTLSGAFRAIRGQVGYFDTTFRLERGTVTFSPTEGLLPTLDASAVTNVGGTEITLTLSGRVDNLATDLSSNPPLSRDQIIATLLHAPQVASLTTGSQQEAQAALFQTAQSYFNAELTRNLLFPFESALAESLNLEQIALIFDPQGNLAVEVRTRFSNTVSALYRSSLTVPVTQSYGVSYRLRDYLALELLQSQPPTGQTSTLVNLRYLFH